MGSDERSAAEHAEVRVEGPRRRIAMRANDWKKLHNAIPVTVFARLMGLFRRFCDGCDHLPEQAFRRLADDQHGRLEEFIATDVRVVGRRGTDEARQTFFVTQVRIASAVGPVLQPVAALQAMLPLEIVVQKERER
jgi:hypothetical protein